ncbi:hypothetical protein DICVIV_09999 [Dictyocaulus viviparus]|uniref:MICOS complex subunit MIC60 n=1 Tax=Dictyocaulus viviparus TaxID=29172 RepID=A0A0D8XNM6_DICVI|nr:hypothetical protein DICVIV_09999 [Dictyocaulus viviparus]
MFFVTQPHFLKISTERLFVLKKITSYCLNFKQKSSKFLLYAISHIAIILSRAKWYVDRNDLISAIRIAQLLRGEPARVVRDWLVDTRSYLETLLLAQLLMAHAAVSSIRSTY